MANPRFWAQSHQIQVSDSAKKHRSPAKQRRDRERAIRYRHEEIKGVERRNRIAQILESARKADEKRRELQRLFGYYEDPAGACFTSGQLRVCLDAIAREEIPPDAVAVGSLVFHAPEAVTDVVKSIGEVDVAWGGCYPVLGLFEGEVLRDPKIRFLCPLLK